MSNDSKRDVNFVGGLKDTTMKTYSTFIDDSTDKRIAVIYEAYSDTKDTQKCLATVYVYHGASSDVRYTIEKNATGNGQWDVDSQADAAAYFTVNGEI